MFICLPHHMKWPSVITVRLRESTSCFKLCFYVKGIVKKFVKYSFLLSLSDDSISMNHVITQDKFRFLSYLFIPVQCVFGAGRLFDSWKCCLQRCQELQYGFLQRSREPLVRSISDSTLYSLRSSGIHPPSVKLIGWTVLDMRRTVIHTCIHTDRQRFSSFIVRWCYYSATYWSHGH